MDAITSFIVKNEIWIKILTLIFTAIIGFVQILINIRLKSLQDFVAIAAVPGSGGKIVLINTGKINLYLWGFDLPDGNWHFKKPRLIPTGTYDSASYWINPPTNLKEGEEFLGKVYLEDQFKKRWVFELGGRLDKIGVSKDKNGQAEKYGIIVWSHKTYKKKWSFKN